LPELHDELPVRPGGVRTQELEESALLGRGLPVVEGSRTGGKFNQGHSLVGVLVIGAGVGLQLRLDATQFSSPLPGFSVVELRGDLPIQLVVVRRIKSAL
jgi:hypothetical protein